MGAFRGRGRGGGLAGSKSELTWESRKLMGGGLEKELSQGKEKEKP